MKKLPVVLVLLGLILCLCLSSFAEEDEDLSEWTILGYFCGSDLESRHALATDNLEEILEDVPPRFLGMDDFGPESIKWDEAKTTGNVNIIFETGGCAEWHTEEKLEVNISNQKLQRYQYIPMSEETDLELVMELPLLSMAEPETLTDFIRWGVATYPAQRYGLLLWDHGDGARTGLLSDELFDDDVMYLYELHQALEEAGVTFEIVVFDACMMANLETAWAIKDHAKWMIAPEDLFSGHGIDYSNLIQQLYMYAGCDGRQLGQMICDFTEEKYANLMDRLGAMTLTLSMIDLSKVEPLTDCFDRMFEWIGRCYEDNLYALDMLFSEMNDAEQYISGSTRMVDLGGILYDKASIFALGPDRRNEFVNVLNEAIPYSVRGNARSSAHGISFCAGMSLSARELEIYAKNCPSPHYLALLDALNNEWVAPDWVYERARRLTSVKDKQQINPVLCREWRDGKPSIRVIKNTDWIADCIYRVCYHDERTDQMISLGTDSCVVKEENGSTSFAVDFRETWPSIDGELCSPDLFQENIYQALYDIPIRMEETVYNLRCSFKYTRNIALQVEVNYPDIDYSGEYQIYGVWEGYNEDNEMPGRNTISLSQLQGREFELLYPVVVDGQVSAGYYQKSQPLRLYRGMAIKEIPLPVGDYTITFSLRNIFMQTTVLEPVEMYWDGAQFTPRGEWTGIMDHYVWK